MEKIKEMFDEVIKHSQTGIDEPKTDRLFELWNNNKRHIVEAFGGKYIYELPEKVSFEITKEAQTERIDSFINYLYDQGYNELSYFLCAQKDGFFDNKVIEEYKTNDEKQTLITKNTKLVKAFKHFIKDKNDLFNIQNKASQLIQENKVEGKLCFSVHPLDYLSISENTYNWRSCHALDGEYRAGNLSYMMDSSTVVCYLKGEENTKLPNFPETVPWNSKKWRVLLYLSSDWKMIFAGKPYPFYSESGMQIIIDNFNKKIFHKPTLHYWDRPEANAVWCNWSNYYLNSLERPEDKRSINYNLQHTYVPVNGALIELNDLVKDVEGAKQFNDVLHSSSYTPLYTHLIRPNSWTENFIPLNNIYTKFNIGNYTYCLKCGEVEVLDSAGTMMCYECEYKFGVSENDIFGFCAKCGRRLLTEDSNYVDDVDVYCNECFDEYAATCNNCGEAYCKESMIYKEKEDAYYCCWCNANVQCPNEMERLEEEFQQIIKNAWRKLNG